MPYPDSPEQLNLGRSDLRVGRICLGTMTFGEQVSEADAHRILDRALDLGIDFLDTAEMYAAPPRRETYGATEKIIGNWFASRPGARRKVVLASKVAGPSRGMDWVRNGAPDLKPEHVAQACDESLARLKTDVIDLYQIHWPNRNGPWFGSMYFDPSKDTPADQPERAFTSIHDQLDALGKLIRAGKVRHIGLSNETPWGLMEFLRIAERHGLPRVVSVQNPYALVNRVVDNGLDEALYRTGVSLLGYSPLGFGTLTGKYDATGFEGLPADHGRIARFEAVRKQRWARAGTLQAARRYNALAREHGLTPTAMALSFCYHSWRVASTIIGVTSTAQLDEAVKAWDLKLGPELLAAIDAIRAELRDPAQ